MGKNCPNCGAPIDPWKYKCEYCGTTIIDLGVLDLDKPCYVTFKTRMSGKEQLITALVQASNPYVEVFSDTTDIVDPYGRYVKRINNAINCSIDLHLDCLTDTSNKQLLQIVTIDEENE